jgi:hypothetical protein
MFGFRHSVERQTKGLKGERVDMALLRLRAPTKIVVGFNFEGVNAFQTHNHCVCFNRLIGSSPSAGDRQEGTSGRQSETRAVYYVDNGKCLKGQLLMVAAGSFGADRSGGKGATQSRERKCVAQP